MRILAAGLVLLFATAAAWAQAAAMTVSQLLREGYEIKTAFYDNGGSAYIILQRSTSAYMCHSAPTQTCEKLN